MIKNLIGVMLAAMLFIGLPGIFIQSREESTSKKDYGNNFIACNRNNRCCRSLVVQFIIHQIFLVDVLSRKEALKMKYRFT